MRCPYCSFEDTRVLDTRTLNEGDNIRRKRLCTNCNERFSTIETVEFSYPTVVKKDESRAEFNVDRIIAGIRRACEKRPISEDTIQDVARKVCGDVRALPDKEVSSQYIGNLVMEQLKDLDHVAYVRFASVYRSFKDVNEFMDELKHLLVKKK